MIRTIGTEIEQLINKLTPVRSLNEDVALHEKEKQVRLASKEIKNDSSDNKPQKDPDVEKKDSTTVENVPTSDDIAEKLNAIRSGRSLRDSGVKDRFERYIVDLSDAEKIALFKFLKGIGQIITGDLDPESAMEPEDPPTKVNISTKKIQKIKKKPSVTKKPNVSKNGSSTEDTTPPAEVPIKAK